MFLHGIGILALECFGFFLETETCHSLAVQLLLEGGGALHGHHGALPGDPQGVREDVAAQGWRDVPYFYAAGNALITLSNVQLNRLKNLLS